jgi:hypothetical protein
MQSKMKILKHILILTFGALLFSACNKGIDPISYVAPGADQSAPQITISYPSEGTSIQVPDLVASIDIKFVATDDIELKSIKVKLDGTDITSYSIFKDYRRLVGEYLYNNVTNGAHVLTVEATDMSSKVTTKTVNFEKKPPYIPKYDGEVFYMPFDGDYVEKISFASATTVGSPAFAGESLKGLDAYKGATDAYLTFPTTAIKGTAFSACFWYKVNSTPDRSGILSASIPGEDRTKGFRLFREGDATSQRIKLNVGTGSGETWNDGGVLTAPATGWVFVTMTVSQTACDIYFNGTLALEAANTGIDWTGCDVLSIGSGAPNFTYWGHNSDLSEMDELRMFNKALTPAEITKIMNDDMPYSPKYDGEIFYMPFEGSYKELISKDEATEVGTPAFDEGKVGQAYAGAEGSYLTFPTTELVKSPNLSVVFWMKVNATPDRAGILVAGPEDTGNAGYPATQNLRTSGFRVFREANAALQQFKLNVGTGAGESWNDGGTVDPTAGTWVHFAYTIAADKSTIYINGEVARESATTPMDWTGCDLLSIMSGAPRFTEWGHMSDQSLMDELRIFNKALTQTEIQTIMNAEK